MSVLSRVIKAAIEGTEILPDDIYAINFDGFVSGFQVGVEEGRKLEREKQKEKEISKSELKENIEIVLDLITDKRKLKPSLVEPLVENRLSLEQVDLETFCEEKEMDHDLLYVTRIKKCRVSEISKEPGKRMDFILEDGPYDECCKDRIGSISFFSLEEEVKELRKCGLCDLQIDRLYKQPNVVFEKIEIFVDVGYRVSKFNLQKRGR